MKEKYTLKVDSEENVQTNDCSSDSIGLTKDVYNAMEVVDSLTRYDDLDSLKIPLSAYEKKNETDVFGILRDPNKHIGSQYVILDRQKEAARRFLLERRGFGILADCVGSGKTYEACVVLSELAFRNKIKSILLIVPDESIEEHWVRVLEQNFGLGIGKIIKLISRENKKADYKPKFNERYVDEIFVNNNLENPPIGTYVVDHEDFVKWDVDNVIKRIYFDAVVLDEAHNLCLNKNDNLKAMYYMSLMAKIKIEKKVPYFLLLTATPHNGNLADMFRLWYFVRCTGGDPRNFTVENESERIYGNYVKEREFYLKTICKGATTVAEYIEKAKEDCLVGGFNNIYREDFFNAFDYYNGRTEIKYPLLDMDAWEKMSSGDKKKRINDYINERFRDYRYRGAERNIKGEVLDSVSKSYYSNVMRSIMIRQPNSIKKGREAINYYILPVTETPTVPKSKIKDSNIFINNIPYELVDDEDSLFDVLLSSNLFSKKSSNDFYKEQFRQDESVFNKTYDKQNICTIVSDGKNEEQIIFEYKCRLLWDICRKHPNEKIIVFFNYDKDANKGLDDTTKPSWERIQQYFEENEAYEILTRIIHAKLDTIKEDIKEFDKSNNALFLAEDDKYTQGQNLQSGNIVVNFEVSCDPICMDQQIGRVYRLGQVKDVVIYSFAAMNQLEGYCLAYYSKIGLIGDANGDATIIAGSNNEKMKAIQCRACNKVELVADVDWAEMQLNGQDRCRNIKDKCQANDPRGTKMTEININEWKCDLCGARLRRKTNKGKGNNSDFVFVCFSSAKPLEKVATDDGLVDANVVQCSKMCAIKHCKLLERDKIEIKGKMVPRCKIIRDDITSPVEAMQSCFECDNRDECCSMLPRFGKEASVIDGCVTCKESKCNPKPFVIKLSSRYNPICPKCGRGTLIEQKPNTFAAFIQSIWNFEDGGKSFCPIFLGEAIKTNDIKQVLSNTKED